MGNVNGREYVDEEDDDENEEEVEEEGLIVHEGVAVADGAHILYRPQGVCQKLLGGQSPPQSPTATRSPLIFTPQVPLTPLRKPDEMLVISQSQMMQGSLGYEETCEQSIPTMITWTYGGKEVAIEGSWDLWRTRTPLQRSGRDFTIMKVLPAGVYQYRFLVDGQWRYSPELPWGQDDVGNAYNVLDLQDNVPEDIESISSFEPPQSPDSSYDNLLLGSDDYAKEPPLVPPHLQKTLLDSPSSYMEIPPCLSRPQHVVLNHLYMQRGKSGPSIVALGTTHRFLTKYVTVVLYKSFQR
ncbi:SNF1-related protein kinase regulatory subunit beta-2-like [Cucurbita pepo subsp. pepo]|uniref:SNF1-related protein kinase regulatory subunit beta-2-like n=1 Tax=Cucurbita pepo subsp. pepo TaxID=3664 RepID=UPI000C9D2F9E|nr:SNF1-related protein kinase regulatory subunit beta-2-like [Cucurbita pepo subsp. pepo]